MVAIRDSKSRCSHRYVDKFVVRARTYVHGLILGTNDLGKDLQLRPSVGPISRSGLVTSIQYTILAARAYNKIVIDGVYNDT